MAFCTACGAQVAGAFCQQCGAPAPGSSPAPNPEPVYSAPVYGAPAPPPAAPPLQARRTSPLVWILVAIVGFFVLCGVFVVGLGLFAVHKAKQAGFDPALMSRNPGLAVSKMIMAANPDAEVMNSDDGAGTITVRDRKTGKVVTMTFDQAKNGKFSFSAQGEDGKTATMEFGGGAAKLPSWVPDYPGSSANGTFAVKGGDSGATDAGSFSFTTSDATTKVMGFYKDKAKDLGLKVNLDTTTNDGGMFIAVDDGEKRSLTVIVGGNGSGQTTVSVTYGRKN
jgi:hypothetical protein